MKALLASSLYNPAFMTAVAKAMVNAVLEAKRFAKVTKLFVVRISHACLSIEED